MLLGGLVIVSFEVLVDSLVVDHPIHQIVRIVGELFQRKQSPHNFLDDHSQVSFIHVSFHVLSEHISTSTEWYVSPDAIFY